MNRWVIEQRKPETSPEAKMTEPKPSLLLQGRVVRRQGSQGKAVRWG